MKNTFTPRFKKNFSLALCLFSFTLIFLTAGKAYGQLITNYAFDTTGATYSAITGSTVLIGNDAATHDDDVSAATAIGFPFWFNGVKYDYFVACVNGWIRLGQNASVSLANPTALSSAYTNAIGNATNSQL